MKRYYQLSKAISDEAKAAALGEMNALDNVKEAKITEDGKFLAVETADGEYSAVMSAAVNIFNRVAGGCALSFVRFSVD